MPIFAYTGVDARGKSVKGQKDADSAKTLRQTLRKDGIMVSSVNETLAQPPGHGGSLTVQGLGSRKIEQRISAQDLAMATRQLATLVGASIPPVDALHA